MSDALAMRIPSVPSATYRLQFHKSFRFRDARAIVDYLADLGISHVYASPILAARPGSTHGYDIVDHNAFNPELGSADEFDELVAALHARGLGIVLDIVPNHMGVGGKDNAWWLDVLEWGRDSPYASFFDIDWRAARAGERGKVLIPVLGDQYGKTLASGDIRLAFDPAAGTFSAWYYDHRFPIDPRDYASILQPNGDSAPGRLKTAVDEWRAFAVTERPSEAYERAAAMKRQLAEIAGADRAAAQWLDDLARGFDGNPGDLGSWMRLHELLEAQSYRPAYWRVAADEINYRRFFNINDLAGIRVEEREVFEATHRFVLSLLKDGKVHGLRIDHIDGLFDPKAYCERLRAKAARPDGSLYLVVEKILAPHERLPADWPVAGTSGYDTLNLVNGVFVDPAGRARLDRFYGRFTGRRESFDEVLHQSKKRIMQFNLASEMNVLAHELHRLSSKHLPTRDYTVRGLRDALEEALAELPVYRTYVTQDGAAVSDRRYVDWAIARAKRNSQAADTSVFDFLHSVMTGDAARMPGFEADEVLRVAMKVQQVSGPVMAKGMEDTAFYRRFPLLSLNEVGGDPRRFAVSPAAFHQANRERLARLPLDMLASSTHDTKRGEDARARINVLSEIPGDWAREVLRWTRLNRSRRSEVEEIAAPEPNHEYLFYSTLVGAWPFDLDVEDEQAMQGFAERIDAFMQKAVREGKERSSWGNPNAPYEAAVSRFVHGALEASATNLFPRAFADFHARRIARCGAVNSLAQTLLKLTMPGVPDTYRGSELWDFSLVDPDNRRPVDYEARRRLMEFLRRADDVEARNGALRREELLKDLAANWHDGREKLFLTREVLRFRRNDAELFARGGYEPMEADGPRAEHLCAFNRTLGASSVVVVVPRFVAKLGQAFGSTGHGSLWQGTGLTVPLGRFRDLFTHRIFDGGHRGAQELLLGFPVAMLTRIA
jgi:(1->4)-alpha-D-glucan 1-alpha-D-glucosylmutase